MGETLVLVTYYGTEREPISTAVKHLEQQHGWQVVDCPLYKWRTDVNERRVDYLDAAVRVVCECEARVVLFWYHTLTVVELKYLRERVPKYTRFSLFTWDDPFDWHSLFLNMKEIQHYFSDGGVLTCCEETITTPVYSVPATYCLPGYVESIAANAVEQYAGPDRFECDVCFMCTNLYAKEDVYSEQKIRRKDLVNALYAAEDIDFHIYGPETFRDAYPRAYRGFVPFEKTYELMRTCRVCVSTHVVSRNIETYANERTVVAMGCGALLLTDIVPPNSGALDIGSSVDEALSRVRSALQLPYEQAESIRNQLRTFAFERLTWRHWSDVVTNHLRNVPEFATLSSSSSSLHVEAGDSNSGGDGDDETKISDFSVSRQVFLQPILSEATDPSHGRWIFDIAVSIGSWCASAHHLRERRLRFETFPFDWTFTNLDVVIKSIPQTGALTMVNEFLTPPQNRTHFSSDMQQQVGFPHNNPNTLDGIRYIRRACERWRRLLHALPEKSRSVLFLHTPRPCERVSAIRRNLDRFSSLLRKHCPHVDAHVISIWHQVWNPNDPDEDYVNRLQYVERTQDHTIFLAHVSSEWDGDDWAGTQHGELWDQVFQYFRIRDESNCLSTASLVPSM